MSRSSRYGQSGALVLGGGLVGLGVVRSLGRHGIPVWLLSSAYNPATASRFHRRSLKWPSTDTVRQLARLRELADRYGLTGWMLFPTGDEDAAFIARNHAELRGTFSLTTPPWEQFRVAFDKRLLYHQAAQLQISYPWTQVATRREELAELNCPFPVILKPAFKETSNAFTEARAWRIENRQELSARYDEACSIVSPEMIMIQEVIPAESAPQYSFAALCRDGKLLAWVAARRTRRYPTAFGVSCLVETLDLPEIEEPSRRLLARIGITGMVEMDWIRDPRTGAYNLLDVNVRAWGWHSLGSRAGIDFPFLLWCILRGARLRERKGRTGLRWVHMIPDMQGAFTQIRQGTLGMSEYLWSLRPPIESAVFALDDPLPALVEVPLLLARRLRDRSAVAR